MLAGQLERRQVVVEFGGLPSGGGVAGAAIWPQIALMNIVFEVAVHAFCRGCFEICQGFCVQMTFGAGQFCVRALWIKGYPGVIKFFIDAFLAIMAGKAIGCVFAGMGSNESRITFGVTGSTIAGCEGFITIYVACLADKWRTIGGLFVGCGCKPK